MNSSGLFISVLFYVFTSVGGLDLQLTHERCFYLLSPFSKLVDLVFVHFFLNSFYFFTSSTQPLFHLQSFPLCPSGIFKSTCYIDVRWFPFDVQRCDLKFGSWTYGGWSLDLQMIDADVTGYIANGEWDLVGESRGNVIWMFLSSSMRAN